MFRIIFVALVLFGSLFLVFKTYHFWYGNILIKKLEQIYEDKEVQCISTTYLLLGDSRIVQWNIPDSIIPSNQIFNYGIDGQTSGQALHRARDYFRRYNSVYSIIQIGINDLKIIGLYPERSKDISDLTMKNIKSLVKLCQEKQSTPILMTIIPPGRVELKRFLFWNRKVNESVVQVNKRIISYCKNSGIFVFNSSELFSGDGLSIKEEYRKDCLHLNKKGYQILNYELNNIIKSHLLDQQFY